MRKTLEGIKSLLDEIYRYEPEHWQGAKAMLLHPPATGQEIEKFFLASPGKGLPPSYSELLQASNGVELSWERIYFLGTDENRQRTISEFHQDSCVRHEGSFKTFQQEVTEENIRDWEQHTGRLYMPSHPLLGASSRGDLVIANRQHPTARRRDGNLPLEPDNRTLRTLCGFALLLRGDPRGGDCLPRLRDQADQATASRYNMTQLGPFAPVDGSFDPVGCHLPS